MILLDLIKLKLRMPSTARFLSDAGVVIGAAGAIAFFMSVSLPVRPSIIIYAGIAIWQLAEWRLRILRRSGR